MKRVGLVGARGYVGREMVRLIEAEPDLTLTLATSRGLDGRTVADAFEGCRSDLVIEDLSPTRVAAAGCDAYVLGLPNGLAAPFVEAIERAVPDSVIVDLSADHRDRESWVYGLPELNRERLRGATRIANPGCYATAAILGLWPLRDLFTGIPSVFGVSGWSGAGTTPGPRNDPDRLRDNILPYGFGGHGHQQEIGRVVGAPVAFAPHVASFFRGLIVTCMVPVSGPLSPDDLRDRYHAAYAESGVVHLQTDPPEPRQVAETPDAVIGGFAIDPATHLVTLSSALDNLLKGAASQAMVNLHLALGP